MVRLLTAFKTVAFLADAGCIESAFELLKTLDQIAMGLEMYYNYHYQIARMVLIQYIQATVDSPGDWHFNEL